MIFNELDAINAKPAAFEFYTAADLWTNEHTSAQMLALHLDENSDLASRNPAFIERSCRWLCGRFGLGGASQVADFGCGPGLYANRLAQAGARVTAIDFSARSLEYARGQAKQNGLDINYIHQDYLQFDSDQRFDLIVMIYCDFCALSPQQQMTMLKKFHHLLKPQGRFVMDVYSHAAFARRDEVVSYAKNLLHGFWSARPYYGFLNTFKYEPEKVILDKYSIIEENSTRTVYNWLKYFTPETLRDTFAQTGLVIEEVYGDVAGADYDEQADVFAVVARKM